MARQKEQTTVTSLEELLAPASQIPASQYLEDGELLNLPTTLQESLSHLRGRDKCHGLSNMEASLVYDSLDFSRFENRYLRVKLYRLYCLFVMAITLAPVFRPEVLSRFEEFGIQNMWCAAFFFLMSWGYLEGDVEDAQSFWRDCLMFRGWKQKQKQYLQQIETDSQHLGITNAVDYSPKRTARITIKTVRSSLRKKFRKQVKNSDKMGDEV